MRNVAAAQYGDRNHEDDENDDDEDDDDTDGQEVLFEHRNGSDRSKKRRRRENRNSPVEEDEVTIFSRNPPSIPPPPRSVTGELSSLLFKQQHPESGAGAGSGSGAGPKMKKSATSVSFQSISLTDAPPGDHPPKRHSKKRRSIQSGPGPGPTPESHNCIRSPCTPTINTTDPFYHLYQREQPEGMPYCETFSMYAPSSTAVNQCLVYRKAKLWLGFCLSAHLACAICVVRGWHQLESGLWWMYAMSAMSFMAAIVGTVALGWLPQSIDNRVRHQVPAVPYLALLNNFLLSLMLASADFGGVWKVAVLLAVGIIVYALYGYKHSMENLRSLHIAPQTLSSETDENTGLVAPLSAYQISESTSKNSFGPTIRNGTGGNQNDGGKENPVF